MIPKICANCANCLLITNNNQVAFGECIAHATRVFIQDPANYLCNKDFEMLERPNYQLEDKDESLNGLRPETGAGEQAFEDPAE